jgi:hypothetical protein
MKRWYLAILSVCISAMTCASTHAGVIAIPPAGPNRIAKADAVIVGKVDAIEPQDVKVGNATYRIAVVRIEQAIRGVKEAKSLRIGFTPPPPPPDGKGPLVFTSGPRPIHLKVGQESLFLLTKLPKENVYVIGGIVGYHIDRDKNPTFDKEVELAKVAVKVIDNPQDALKSKDTDERLLAAAYLIENYRSFKGPAVPKLEAIDADESKLILQTLVNADWKANADFRSIRPAPWQLFQKLGVTAKDGYAPQPGVNYQAAMQSWLSENAQKYRIQRFAANETK